MSNVRVFDKARGQYQGLVFNEIIGALEYARELAVSRGGCISDFEIDDHASGDCLFVRRTRNVGGGPLSIGHRPLDRDSDGNSIAVAA